MNRILLILFIIQSLLASGLIAQNNVQEMALIPGGEYLMGRISEKNADYSPAHTIKLDSFYIDIHEVTNAEYYVFCKETDHTLPEFWGIEKYRSGLEYPDYPVLGVSNGDAQAYAKYIGKRLATEAEWEFAARGGLTDKKYSNGDDFKTCINLDTIFKDGKRHPYPVLYGNPNNYGLYGMSGNVREWVRDYYDKNYYKNSPTDNPKGPEKGRFNVVRGGGWKSGSSCKAIYIRNALRGSWVDIGIGFRCAKDIK